MVFARLEAAFHVGDLVLALLAVALEVGFQPDRLVLGFEQGLLLDPFGILLGVLDDPLGRFLGDTDLLLRQLPPDGQIGHRQPEDDQGGDNDVTQRIHGHDVVPLSDTLRMN